MTMFPSAKGSITFHPKRMSWSYRRRGSVARSQKNRNKKPYTFTVNQATPSIQARLAGSRVPGYGAWYPPRNRTEAMQETRIMFAYSAMKKKAKRIPLYSVIQPATSSLSASGRSKAESELVAGWMTEYSGMRFRSEEHTSELQSRENLVCRLLLEKKKKTNT